MTFLDGLLFACEAQRNANTNTEPTGTSKLAVIDPSTGIVSNIAALPDNIDALAGNFR